jgi:XTP/dITP diphosphohydrolase
VSSTDRLVLVTSSSRVAPGLLSWSAWQELHTGHVCVGDPDHPWLPALAAADVTVEVLGADNGWPELAARFRSRAADGRTAVWVAGPTGDGAFTAELRRLVTTETAAGGVVELEVISGSYDLPGARLLDVVATMDRLRSPGGCPWDAEQSHESLAPYLLEEAYEAVDAIERGDLAGLRDELGDVLLQVAFHSRLAEERQETGWTIDDVAAGLVDKLVRRHPHVFAGRKVAGVPDVLANWEAIKAAEGRTSATEGVPLGAPALALAAKLQQRASSAGLPPLLMTGVAAAETLPRAVAAAAAALADDSSGRVEGIGELLFAAVALARFHDVDPEAALRGTARRFRDRLAAVERSAGQVTTGLGDLDAMGWQQRWSAASDYELVATLDEPSDDELLAGEAGPSSR